MTWIQGLSGESETEFRERLRDVFVTTLRLSGFLSVFGLEVAAATPLSPWLQQKFPGLRWG